jgi:hypothetical protein
MVAASLILYAIRNVTGMPENERNWVQVGLRAMTMGAEQFSASSSSRRSREGSQPPQQKEVVAAQLTSVRREKPTQSRFHGISGTDASKLDGLAMGTARMEHNLLILLFLARCYESPSPERATLDSRLCFFSL